MTSHPVNKFVDIHHHLDTLNFFISLRARLKKHLITINDYKYSDRKTILSVPLYVNFYCNYDFLKEAVIKLKKEVKYAGEDVVLILGKNDLHKDFKVGIILHIESARTLKKFNEQLIELFDLGVRGVIPLHFKDNHLGNSCDDPFRRLNLKKDDLGITDLGVAFIDKCNQLGLWIDMTHTTNQTGDDFLKLANTVIVSHVGIKELVNVQRNKSLSFLKGLVEKDGLIGLTPWKHLVGSSKENFSNMVDYAINNGLENHICFGSDFGAPIDSTPFIKSVFDVEKIIDHKGFIADNAFRFFDENLPS